MPLAVGDRIPEVSLRQMTPHGPQPISSTEALGSGTVVLFGVPGAFTPTCNDHHLPGFVLRHDDLKAKGVDTIACVAVNDAFVMGAWGESQQVGDKILMLADGSGEFAKATDLELDLTGLGLGVRSRRYAAILDDGVVRELFVEEGGQLERSSADAVLAAL